MLLVLDVLIAESRQRVAEKHAENLNKVLEALDESSKDVEGVCDHSRQTIGKQVLLIQQLQDEIAKSYSENVELQVF